MLKKILALIYKNPHKVKASDFLLHSLEQIGKRDQIKETPQQIDNYFSLIFFQHSCNAPKDCLLDLKIESFIKTFDKDIIAKYYKSNKEASLKTYLAKVLINTIKQSIRNLKSLHFTTEYNDNIADDKEMTQIEYSLLVEKAIKYIKKETLEQGKLTAQQTVKMFILMLKGYTKLEIAAHLKISPSRVSVLFKCLLNTLYKFAGENNLKKLQMEIYNYQSKKVSFDEILDCGRMLKKYFTLKNPASRTAATYSITRRKDIESREKINSTLAATAYDNAEPRITEILTQYSDDYDYVIDGDDLVIIRKDK